MEDKQLLTLGDATTVDTTEGKKDDVIGVLVVFSGCGGGVGGGVSGGGGGGGGGGYSYGGGRQ